MVTNARMADLIRENQPEEIEEAVDEGAFFEMQTFTKSLIELVVDGRVDQEIAANASTNRHDFLVALERALKQQRANVAATRRWKSRSKRRNGLPSRRFRRSASPTRRLMRLFIVAAAALAVLAGSASAAEPPVLGFTVSRRPSALARCASERQRPELSGGISIPVSFTTPPADPQRLDLTALHQLWQAAGSAYGVPWNVLAAINKIESNFGGNMGPSSAGAVGWMQFMPSTWLRWGLDADADGIADPWNPTDAVYAAARYLAASGGQTDIRARSIPTTTPSGTSARCSTWRRSTATGRSRRPPTSSGFRPSWTRLGHALSREQAARHRPDDRAFPQSRLHGCTRAPTSGTALGPARRRARRGAVRRPGRRRPRRGRTCPARARSGPVRAPGSAAECPGAVLHTGGRLPDGRAVIRRAVGVPGRRRPGGRVRRAHAPRLSGRRHRGSRGIARLCDLERGGAERLARARRALRHRHDDPHRGRTGLDVLPSRDPAAHRVDGVTLAAGTQIGLVGATGHATGPHLHLQLQPATSYPQYQSWFQSFAGKAFRWQDAPTLLELPGEPPAPKVFSVVPESRDAVVAFTRSGG